MSGTAEGGQEERKIVEKHRGWPKGKKRKPYAKERDENAPRRPVNGYVRYMQEKRESVAAQHPSLPFTEVTKILGTQWTSLPQDEKQKYLDDAESDRAEYLQKLKVYNKNKQTKESESAGYSRASPVERKQSITPPANPEDIPIFTEAFLDHNKAKDAELRQLRKSNAEYAEQNTFLQRHVQNLQTAITKLDAETQVQRQGNYKLQMKLNDMKELIVKRFKDLPLPESELLPTVKNVDSYMKQVYQILQNSSEEHKEFSATVQEIMSKLNKSDLQPLLGGH